MKVVMMMMMMTDDNSHNGLFAECEVSTISEDFVF